MFTLELDDTEDVSMIAENLLEFATSMKLTITEAEGLMSIETDPNKKAILKDNITHFQEDVDRAYKLIHRLQEIFEDAI